MNSFKFGDHKNLFKKKRKIRQSNIFFWKFSFFYWNLLRWFSVGFSSFFLYFFLNLSNFQTLPVLSPLSNPSSVSPTHSCSSRSRRHPTKPVVVRMSVIRGSSCPPRDPPFSWPNSRLELPDWRRKWLRNWRKNRGFMAIWQCWKSTERLMIDWQRRRWLAFSGLFRMSGFSIFWRWEHKEYNSGMMGNLEKNYWPIF